MKTINVHIEEKSGDLTIISLYDKDNNYKGKITIVGKRDKITVQTGPAEDLDWIASKPEGSTLRQGS